MVGERRNQVQVYHQEIELSFKDQNQRKVTIMVASFKVLVEILIKDKAELIQEMAPEAVRLRPKTLALQEIAHQGEVPKMIQWAMQTLYQPVADEER